jgi:hypothetical protein
MKDSKILKKDMLNKSTKRLSNSTNKPMLREKQMMRREPETSLLFPNCKLVIKMSKTQSTVCGIDSTKCKKLNKEQPMLTSCRDNKTTSIHSTWTSSRCKETLIRVT